MYAPRALALVAAALSTTVAALGSATVVNNCGYTITAQTMTDVSRTTLQSEFSIAAGGGSAASGEHTSEGWYIRMWKDNNAGQSLALETRLDGSKVWYDVFEDGGSPVGDAFALTTTDGSCHNIQGGQGNFDPATADQYTCGSDASFTLTLCP